jgi:hypothetical protein
VVLPDVFLLLPLVELLLVSAVTLLEGVRVDDDELLVPEFIQVEETRVDLDERVLEMVAGAVRRSKSDIVLSTLAVSLCTE